MKAFKMAGWCLFRNNPQKDYFGPLPGCPLILLSIPAVLLTAFFTFNFWQNDPWRLTMPSDRRLMAEFEDHRSAFQSVASMIAEDNNAEAWLYSYDYAKPHRHADEEKRAIFDKLIKKIGFGGSVTKNADRSVSFTFVVAWPSGFGLGWAKRIDYKPIFMLTQASILPNLDHAPIRDSSAYYRKIDSDWYLFYYAGER